MINFNQTQKLVRFTAALNSYIASAIAVISTAPDLFTRRKRLAGLVSYFSPIALKILNIDVKVKGTLPNGSYLIVANHMGYIDVLCIASIVRTAFVTSVEIKETPVLGQLTDLGGCLYVERRDKSNLRNEIKDVTKALEVGLNVCVFPEATSTNGDHVIRFRRPLFKAAQEAKKPVVPMTINYEYIDGERVTAKNRDILCWYGDMSFFPHLIALMKRKKIEIVLDIHEPVMIADDHEFDAIAAKTHSIIARQFRPLGANAQPTHSTVQ